MNGARAAGEVNSKVAGSASAVVGVACAIVAAAVVGTAGVAKTQWGATAAGQVVRLWAVPVVLAIVVWAMRRRLRRPTASELAAQAAKGEQERVGAVERQEQGDRHAGGTAAPRGMVGGIALGGLMALANVVAARGGMLQAPRVPFGQETVGLWQAVVVVGVLAPVVEECFFRGILLRYLWARHGAAVGVIVSAAAFALGHGELGLMPQALLGGLILGVTYVRLGALVTPILAHALGNLAAIGLAQVGPGWAADLSPIALAGAAVACVAGLAWAGGLGKAGE